MNQFEVSKQSLEVKPSDCITLNTYANALVVAGQHNEAFKIFKQSLKVEPINHRTLNSYAKALVASGQHSEAFKIFEQSLKVKPSDCITLNTYANALVVAGQHNEAFKVFEQSLKVEPNNHRTFNSYANALVAADQHSEAFKIFEQALKIEPNNHRVLNNYANVLVAAGQHNEAFKIFEQSLKVEPNNFRTLNTYAKALAAAGQNSEAFKMLKQSLKIEPNNHITLNIYANTLVAVGQHDEAFKIFEDSLQIQSNDVITLNDYGIALSKERHHHEALNVFERSLVTKPNDTITLLNYVNTLIKARQYKKAIEYSEHLLSIDPKNTTALIRYGRALTSEGLYNQSLEIYQNLLTFEIDNAYILGQCGILFAKLGEHEKAYSMFSHCLQIRSDNYISFQYARALEETGKYQQAIGQLEGVNFEQLNPYQANVIWISMGRLHYRINSLEKGNEYFDLAIANSDNKEKTLLYAARSIFASDPHSATAVEMLQQIAEDSSHYGQAFEMLALNLGEEEYYDMVKTDSQSELSNIEVLSRAIYHKIANEISILKGIAYRILHPSELKNPLLSDIIQDIENVFTEVDRRRAEQKSEIGSIPRNDYRSILAVISKTAHDISDFVNTQLAIIESKTRRVMRELQLKDGDCTQLDELRKQLELVQTALSDLKSINEGINIKEHHFKVKKLFEKWEPIPQIDHAQIVLDIQNGDSEFNGDEEKIKSALNELVENSLKHNFAHQSLTIHISSRDIMNPSGICGRTIPGEQKYLFIEFTDNGKGVPRDKKNWIFQPLTTTSLEGKGSGLGLFIIRKTLTKMDGYIRETGHNGARFEIYIHYVKEGA
jgi:tetratricopeptide (TPR) repeat protein